MQSLRQSYKESVLYKRRTLEAFLVFYLIPLHKNYGICPIDVVKILRRIADKVVIATVKDDVMSSVGSLQVSVGHDPDCEAVIHPMKSIFCENKTEAILLVDAGNAINSIN